MRMRVCILSTILSCAVGASAAAAHATPNCAETSLQKVIVDPLRYAGRRFCGEVLVAQPDRVTRIMSSAAELTSYGTVVLATIATRHLLGEVGSQQSAYYIEAKIKPQMECFGPETATANECVPFARPVMFAITRAHRLR